MHGPDHAVGSPEGLGMEEMDGMEDDFDFSEENGSVDADA